MTLKVLTRSKPDLISFTVALKWYSNWYSESLQITIISAFSPVNPSTSPVKKSKASSDLLIITSKVSGLGVYVCLGVLLCVLVLVLLMVLTLELDDVGLGVFEEFGIVVLLFVEGLVVEEEAVDGVVVAVCEVNLVILKVLGSLKPGKV